jgi:hypothetical protein
MPRGVYVRKPKDEKSTAPVVAKKAPIIKAAAAKAVTKVAAKVKATPVKTKLQRASAPADEGQAINPTIDYDNSMAGPYGFQILGSNLTTLVGAHAGLIHGTPGKIREALEAEMAETLKLIAALRAKTFGAALAPKLVVTITQPAVESLAEAQDEDTGASEPSAPEEPVAAAPVVHPHTTLPQGNASFTPPAPPALPHH